MSTPAAKREGARRSDRMRWATNAPRPHVTAVPRPIAPNNKDALRLARVRRPALIAPRRRVFLALGFDPDELRVQVVHAIADLSVQ